MEQDLFTNEFDRMYGPEYRKGEGHCVPTNPDNKFDETPVTVKSSNKAIQPSSVTDAQVMAESVKVPLAEKVMVFDTPVVDFINTLLPQGAPVGSRHKFALKLASDLIILLDGDTKRVHSTLLSLPWVQDIVKERGMSEIDHIVESAQKLLQKRESENFSEPQPTKEMRRAIEQVTKRKYSELVKEIRSQAMGQGIAVSKDDIIDTLNRIGKEIKKLFPYYPLLKLACYGLKPKHYVAALFVVGAFSMTLMTRCWYRFWPAPGRHCRLNSLLALIGRLGSGKHIAVEFYKIIMEPVRKADQAQIDALNMWNQEREQNSGASKNKKSRPAGVYRALPPETSAAGAREAECNAHEEVDGEDMFLHCSIFDSELDNTLRQLKKSYMDALLTLWLKSFHNEPHGSFLKTSSARVGEYDVHFNAVYTGTDDALRKLAVTNNFVNGLLSRFTCVPMGDSNFEMMESRDYTKEDEQRDQALKEWAYKLNDTKGEIPCKEISNALHQWTARRMADAKEDNSKAAEDLLKRPCWHGINYALPFIVSRHWDKMVQDSDGRWKCGPDFKVDRNDLKLAVLITQAQWTFQQYFFKGIAEQYYDDTSDAYKHHHQQKTLLAYRRLPEIFSSEDVKREYGYDSIGSTCSRLKILQDDGMAQKIRNGEHKGKYRKLMTY